MEWVNTYRETRGFCLAAVRFSPEEGAPKRTARQARRMNRFYESLETAAEQYAGVCQVENAFSGYVCRIEAVREGEDILVTVRLALRMPGMVSRRKCTVHRWRDGLLTEEKSV